jgi:hypothetical protein
MTRLISLTRELTIDLILVEHHVASTSSRNVGSWTAWPYKLRHYFLSKRQWPFTSRQGGTSCEAFSPVSLRQPYLARYSMWHGQYTSHVLQYVAIHRCYRTVLRVSVARWVINRLWKRRKLENMQFVEWYRWVTCIIHSDSDKTFTVFIRRIGKMAKNYH